MIKDFFSRYWVWLLICLGIIIGISIPAYLHFVKGYVWADCTGFGAYTGPLDKEDREKTLWDILELLIVPAALAVTALLFSNQERKEDRRAAEERAELDRELSTDRIQEQTLQAYLDKMTELLLEQDLRNSESEDEVRTIARARTLTTLRALDGQRKGSLLAFLKETSLIDKGNTLVALRLADLSEGILVGADLIDANLINTNLTEASLLGANMTGADLTGAWLTSANLIYANLSGANLKGANLVRANLTGANLIEADLTKTELGEANLEIAKLKGANLRKTSLLRANLIGVNLTGADLVGADLSGANLTRANLADAILTGADLTGADLTGTDLRGADLSEANLTRADLRGAKITQEQLNSTHSLELAIMPDGTKIKISKRLSYIFPKLFK